MTDKEKQMIAEYRKGRYSYSQIAEAMNISINSIKTYCRRHGLGGNVTKEGTLPTEIGRCECCGKPVLQNPGRKKKRFCSDRCRNKWWNSHMDQVNKKANFECVCAYCKKTFVSYGNKNRKYCSHACYIEDRFGGEA